MEDDDNSILLYIEPLTNRENEVLDEMAKGDTDRQIAVTLVVSHKTIRSHVATILSKLNAHTRTEAVILAQSLGLVPRGVDADPVTTAMVALERIQPGSLARAISVLAEESGEA